MNLIDRIMFYGGIAAALLLLQRIAEELRVAIYLMGGPGR
jgi:hypothetical protein